MSKKVKKLFRNIPMQSDAKHSPMASDCAWPRTGRSWSDVLPAGCHRWPPAAPPECSGSSSRTRTGTDTSCICKMHKIIKHSVKYKDEGGSGEGEGEGRVHIDVLFKLNYRVNTKATGKQRSLINCCLISQRCLIVRFCLPRIVCLCLCWCLSWT